MNQINLFCPHCRGALDVEDYRRLLENPDVKLAACVWCGAVVLTYDTNQFDYLKEMLQCVDLERKILQLCALTGETFEKLKQFVERRDYDAFDLDILIYLAAQGKWTFEDGEI